MLKKAVRRNAWLPFTLDLLQEIVDFSLVLCQNKGKIFCVYEKMCNFAPKVGRKMCIKYIKVGRKMYV